MAETPPDTAVATPPSAATTPAPSMHRANYWTRFVALAAAYSVASWLGLQFQPGNNFGSPFWPAAGVALAGLIVGGIRLWPAIALSSLAEAAWSLSARPDLSPLAIGGVAVAASVGKCLQAVIGAYLVQGKRTGFGFPASDDRIARLFLLSGGVCSTINATIGVAALYVADLIAVDQAAWSWLTTWAGDATGVFLVVPLALLWFAAPRERRARRLATFGTPLPLFVAAVAIVASQLTHADFVRRQSHFERRASAVSSEIRDQFSAAFEVLYGARGLFVASNEVSQKEFRDFVSVYLHRRPALVSVGWLPRVTAAERAAEERKAAIDYPGYHIREHDPENRIVAAGQRDEYYPLRYVVTERAVLAAYGYDVMSVPAWRQAGEAARQRDELIAAAPILLTENSRVANDVMALLPVWSKRRSDAPMERGEFLGYVAALLNVDRLIESAYESAGLALMSPARHDADQSTIPLSFEVSTPLRRDEPPTVIAPGGLSSTDASPAEFAQSFVFDAAGRQWTLRVTAPPTYRPLTPDHWWLLFGATLCGALMGAICLVLASRSAEVQERVDERTRDLAREVLERQRAVIAAEASQAWLELAQTSAGIGVWDWNVESDEVHVSPGQCRLYGLDESNLRVPASVWRARIHPDDRQRISEAGRRAVAEGNAYDAECRVIRPDGAVRWLRHSGRVDRDESGRAVRIIGASWDITEAKLRSLEVDEQQRRFRALTENSEIGFWQVDVEGRATYLNAALCRLLEIDGPEDAMNCDSSEFFAQESRAVLRRQREIRRRGIASTYEATIVGRRGRRSIVMISAAPILDAEGNFRSTIGSYIDITELKEAEQKLRASENELASIYHGVSDAVALWKADRTGQDLAYRCLRVNRSALELFGISEEDIVGRTSHDFARSPLKDRLKSLAAGAIQRKSAVAFVESIDTPQGRRTFDVRFTPLFCDKGNCTHLLVAAHDVTDRVAAEAQLRQAVEFRESIIQNAGEGLCVSQTLDEPPYTRFSVWNQRLEEITGYTLDDVNRHGWLPLLFPDAAARPPMESIRDRVRAGEDMHDQVARLTRKDGEQRFVRFSNTRLADANGQPLVLTFVADITEREMAVEALRLSEERYRGVVSAMAEGVLLVDSRGAIEACNASMCHILGIPESQIVGRDVLELFSLARDEHGRPFGETNCAILASLRDGATFERRVLEIPLPDGTSRWLAANTRPIHGPQGAPVAAIATVSDITHLKQTAERMRAQEQQLAHVSRVSTMGEFVAGIAHEINQPLHAIANFAVACERCLTDDGAGQAQMQNALGWIRHISVSVRQAGAVIRRLRDFFRREGTHRESVSLAATVRQSLDLTQFLVKQHGVSIRLDLDDAEQPLEIDRVQIQQVVVNLLRNAIEAVAPLPPARREICIRAVRRENDVEIVVADSGHGVPAEQVGRLFEPFYTTKSDGMGMGLAISKTIVEAHGGEIWYQPHADNGAGGEFHFTLATAGGATEHMSSLPDEQIAR